MKAAKSAKVCQKQLLLSSLRGLGARRGCVKSASKRGAVIVFAQV
jgi:hypothetical protein